MRYLVQLRDETFVKGYRFLSFANNMGTNISKNAIGKYSQKLFDHTKHYATGAKCNISKRAIQKIAEATDNLISNEITDRITKVSNMLSQNNSETVTNEHGKKNI